MSNETSVAANAADPDPPKHRRHRVTGTLSLNLSTFERLALWQEVSDSEGKATVAVPRIALLHLLLDHATLLAQIVVPVHEPMR